MKLKINVTAKSQDTKDTKKAPVLSETPALEYLDVVKNEYQNERNKKASFESRAGIAIAFIGAICVILFDKIKLSDIGATFNEAITFSILVKNFCAITVYACLLLAMFFLLKTITASKHLNFETKNIDIKLLTEKRIAGIAKITFTYRDIIIQHRQNNEKRAKAYKTALYLIASMFVAMILYLNI